MRQPRDRPLSALEERCPVLEVHVGALLALGNIATPIAPWSWVVLIGMKGTSANRGLAVRWNVCAVAEPCLVALRWRCYPCRRRRRYHEPFGDIVYAIPLHFLGIEQEEDGRKHHGSRCR